MKSRRYAARRITETLCALLALALVIPACDSIITNVFEDDGGKLRGGIDATIIEPPCDEGTLRCERDTVFTCRSGTFEKDEICPMFCDDHVGCVLCRPGTGTCTGDISTVCKEDGTGYKEVFCDSVQGMSCDPGSGTCVGACSPQELGKSYIGCEYYPTILANTVNNNFQFAVAIANTSSIAINMVIENGALTAPISATVGPGSVSIQRLPWVGVLKTANCTTGTDCGPITLGGTRAARGAYHLRSTGPVTVYQFSALDYQLGGSFSYTNDASLLLPTNVMGTDYVVAAWPTWRPGFPGVMTITGTRNGTNLTIISKTATTAGGGAPAFPAGVPTMTAINKGDVMQLYSQSGDFTGTFVSSDYPIQVMGGHYCTNVPANVAACDHLEESMFPVSALGDSYVVSSPIAPALPNGKVRIIRIVSTKANTTVTYDPPQGGAGTTLANAGDTIQITNSAASFVISADHKILVAEYMEGQQAGGGIGDPAFTIAVPSAQYRSTYLFHAPANYSTNYVNIVATTGETVTLDGTDVAGFSPVGGGFSLARVGLSNATGGNHLITGSKPFGITVYGYGQYTSYWYAGGLDLETLSID